jgi:hypothetical protein
MGAGCKFIFKSANQPMKLFNTLLLLIVLFAGCKEGTKDKQPAPVAINVSADSLAGHWIVLHVGISGTNEKYNSLLQAVVEPMKDQMELGMFSFKPGGNLIVDAGSKDYENGKWTVAGNKLNIATKTLSSDRDLPFTVTRFVKDTLTIENIMDKKDDTLHIEYHLRKLRSTDSIADIFDPAMNAWRNKPLKPESNAAIKLRLKQLLHYYSAYFATFRHNKVSFFNRQKILLPLAFYSGGLGLTPFEESDEWKEVFYNTADANKAYKILEGLFDSLEYPDEGNNFVLEYVIALERLSNKL